MYIDFMLLSSNPEREEDKYFYAFCYIQKKKKNWKKWFFWVIRDIFRNVNILFPSDVNRKLLLAIQKHKICMHKKYESIENLNIALNEYNKKDFNFFWIASWIKIKYISYKMSGL